MAALALGLRPAVGTGLGADGLCHCHHRAQRGFSLAFNIVSLLLLTALIAFYYEWRVFYCLSAPLLIFLLFEEHWVMVPSVAVHWLAVMGLLIVLETGRRMLNGWFELAVSREYDNLMLARKMNAMAHRDPLTGLANRRHFDQVCKNAIAQGTTLETPSL